VNPQPTLIDRWKGAAPTQQAGLILGVVLILSAVLATVWFAFLRVEYEPVFERLDETDAATIVGALEKDKVTFKLADQGHTILVPRERADQVRLNILGSDLPLKGAVGFELFNQSDLGVTDFTQKINYQRALQGELARTIQAIDGVDTVRVHLALGENRVFRNDSIPPKASIVVRMINGGQLSGRVAEGIQRLVANAVDQLQPRDVVVLNDAGQVVSVSPQEFEDAAPASLAAAQRNALQTFYEARVRQAVQHQSYGEVQVSVKVLGSEWLGEDDSDDPAKVWDPRNRPFGLVVTLEAPRLAAGSQRAELRDAASKAIAFKADRDIIEFGVITNSAAPLADSTVSAPSQARSVSSQEPVDASDKKTSTWMGLGVFLAVGLGLLSIIGIRRARLRPSERLAFADRLSQLARERQEEGRGA
jgi:flagellar M-ring protein FliF